MAGLFGSKNGAESASAGYDGVTASPDRRKLILGGVAGLAVVALLALVVLPMLTGGGSSSTSVPMASGRHRAVTGTPTPTPSATPSDDFTLAPAAAYGDPFAPLPEEVAASAAAATASAAPQLPSAGTASPAAGTTASATGTGAAVTAGTTSAPAGGATTTDNTPASGKPVQVMAIKGTSADIQIDNMAYTVQAKSTPVSGYTVTSIGGGKVTFTRNGVTHALAEGELQTF